MRSALRLKKTNRWPDSGSTWSWDRTSADRPSGPRRRSVGVVAHQILTAGGSVSMAPPPAGGAAAAPGQVAVGSEAQDQTGRQEQLDRGAGGRSDKADGDEAGRLRGGQGLVALQAAPPS